MIKYVSHEVIDREKWDKCIDNSTNGLVYAYSWYLDLICDEWNALIENDYESVFPLPFRKKGFIQYTYQPFFAQQLGVFSTNVLNSDRIHAFIKAIPKKYALIDINLNSQNFIDDRDIDCKINKNYILDLHHDYKLLHEAFSSNTRRNLHEAKGNHLTVVEGIPSQNIIDLFRKDKGKEIRSFKENDYKTLHQLMNHILDKGKAISLGVNDANNQLLAGAFFVKHNNRYIFLFSGNSDEGRDAKAMFFLIDYFIRKYSNEDLILDFEGSNNHGLARFYSSFGAKKIQYKTYFANRLFFPLNLLFMVYRKFK